MNPCDASHEKVDDFFFFFFGGNACIHFLATIRFWDTAEELLVGVLRRSLVMCIYAFGSRPPLLRSSFDAEEE